MLMHYNDHICNKNNCTDIEGIHKKKTFSKKLKERGISGLLIYV